MKKPKEILQKFRKQSDFFGENKKRSMQDPIYSYKNYAWGESMVVEYVEELDLGIIITFDELMYIFQDGKFVHVSHGYKYTLDWIKDIIKEDKAVYLCDDESGPDFFDYKENEQ